jgi:site-specific DNA-methyltransferase (adenine-specific)
MINKGLFASISNEWETPQKFYEELDKEFHFDLDPSSNTQNHKCKFYYTIFDDGLKKDWFGNVFCNPPYGKELGNWVEKAYKETLIMNNCDLCVMLIPARTDTKYFHTYIYNVNGVEIRFLKGRLKFSNSKQSAPFPSMLVIFRNEKENKQWK